MAMIATLSSQGSLTGEKLGRVNLNVFDNLVPGQGLTILKMANDLFARGNADYLEGMDKASMTMAVIYGSNDFDTHPDVVNAREIAKEMTSHFGQAGTRLGPAEVGSMLQFSLFNSVVKKRLGKGA
jgi:hypothetical protein